MVWETLKREKVGMESWLERTARKYYERKMATLYFFNIRKYHDIYTMGLGATSLLLKAI